MKFVAFFCLFSLHSMSQNTILGISAHYSYQIPMGDMGTKFGNNSNVSIGCNVKSRKNWTLGVEGAFIFGSKYKNLEPLGSYISSGGFVIGKESSIETPTYEGRGGNFTLEIGKIIPINKQNLNSGIHAKLGFGYFFHKANLSIDPILVPQLSDVYQQGYDHAESGWSVNPYIGYTLYGKQRLLNFSLGIQGILAFTKSDRVWDFATDKSIQNETYTNFLIGPKATFTIPIYKSSISELKDQFYYN